MCGMCRLIAAVMITVSLSGCVIYIHDPKINELKPARAELRDFAGTYKGSAIYFTPPNAFGLEGNDSLADILNVGFRSDVQIEAANTGDILVKAVHDRFGLPATHYVKGKDFDFANYCVVFRGKNCASGNDSEFIGIGRTSMVWTLDSSNNLVVTYGGEGMGFLTIIPFVMDGSALSVFPRVQTNIDVTRVK
jgi:hypothetical protein